MEAAFWYAPPAVSCRWLSINPTKSRVDCPLYHFLVEPTKKVSLIKCSCSKSRRMYRGPRERFEPEGKPPASKVRPLGLLSGPTNFSCNRSKSTSPCGGSTGPRDFALAFSASMIPEAVPPGDGTWVSCATLDAHLRQLIVRVVNTAIVRKTFLVIVVSSSSS